MDILDILGLGSLVDIKFLLDEQDAHLPVYRVEEPVKGSVLVKPKKKIEHKGIIIDFIGEIDIIYDRGNHYDFMYLTKTLVPYGDISDETKFDFDFPSTEKIHESYNGVNVKLRYFLRFTIIRNFAANIVREQEIWVINFTNPPELNSSIKMEVGIEECLHIEFEYGRSKYHLKDVILGKVYFLLVRLKIKYMELALIRRETTGVSPNAYTETETLTKFEIMDGAPVRGESIPVRLYLGAFDLTPSYKSVCGKFTVKYLLNLVLVDEEDRRYFKQTDITLWRKQGYEEKKLFTIRDAYLCLELGKKERRKRRREKKEKNENILRNKIAHEEDKNEEEEEEEEEYIDGAGDNRDE